MTAGTSSIAIPPAPPLSADGELVLTRTFAAPRERVFAAWTDPEQFARWFGPWNCTVLVRTMDVRPGGALHFCHRFPGGDDVWAAGVYREVDEPRRLVFTTYFSDPAGGRVERPGFPRDMRVTVTFAERDGGTEMTVRHAGLVVDQGEGQGWTETLARLGEHLASPSPTSTSHPEESVSPTDDQTASTEDREIVITRVLDAPRERVFEAWTDPRQVGHWWGPTGFTTTIHEMDVRPGGVWRFIMHGPDGVDYPNQVDYIEVVRPERLVYDHGSGGDPEFHVTVTFADEDGRTRLTLRSLFPTAAAREHKVRVVKAIEGGNQTVDRLAQYLANG